MLKLLFEYTKIYGKTIKQYKLNDLQYWNKIKNFIQNYNQEKSLNELNKIINEWNVKISSNIEEIPKFFLQMLKNNEIGLLKLLEIAYNLGQLSLYLKTDNFNKLENYVNITSTQYDEININISISNFIDDVKTFILEQINLIEINNRTTEEIFFSKNIRELTLNNNVYKKVMYTGKNQQFVLMSIQPNNVTNINNNKDQFVKIEQGKGKLIIDKKIYNLQENTTFIVPAEMNYKIINTDKKPLKLHTLYVLP